MRHRLIASAILAAAVGGPAGAAEPYEIHVLATLTGPSAFVGRYMRQNLEIFEEVANRQGGIAGRPLKFVFGDTESVPQTAVQLASPLVAQRPAVIMVTGPVANCAAVEPLTRKAGPVMWCLSPALHPKPESFALSAGPSSYDGIATVLRYYKLKGWTKIAILNPTDATGQDADRGIEQDLKLPEFADVKVVAHEHYNPSDLSVGGQLQRIRDAGAQALIAWCTGSPLATVLKGMVQSGLDIPVVPSGGNEVFQQLQQYQSFLPNQFLVPSAAFPEHEGLLTLDPRVEKLQHEMYAALAAHGLKSDNNTADTWDAALITVAGLRALGPDADAAQLRKWILALTDFPGIDGLYDFPKYPERGLGSELNIVVRYDPKGPSWVWLTKPGGTPLDQ